MVKKAREVLRLPVLEVSDGSLGEAEVTMGVREGMTVL